MDSNLDDYSNYELLEMIDLFSEANLDFDKSYLSEWFRREADGQFSEKYRAKAENVIKKWKIMSQKENT